MKNPPHPGQIVKHDVIEPLRLSVTAAAGVLGVSRKTLSALVNERAGVSADMAVRLEKAFGSTARLWLDLQAAYDLAQVKREAIAVDRYQAPEERRSGDDWVAPGNHSPGAPTDPDVRN